MTVKINRQVFQRRMRAVEQVPNEVIKETFEYFRSITPRRTGNARKNTELNIESKTITANYGYAQVLDNGRKMTNRGMRGSTQAPQGMTRPTLRELNNILRRNLRKI